MSERKPTEATVVAAMMLAADHGIDLHKIVTRKAGVNHTTRDAKQARKAWRKNRANLPKPGATR